VCVGGVQQQHQHDGSRAAAAANPTQPCCVVRHTGQVDRLGDNRQDVRQAACNLLLELLQVCVCVCVCRTARRRGSHNTPWQLPSPLTRAPAHSPYTYTHVTTLRTSQTHATPTTLRSCAPM
jgi:hypothetical protein